MKSQEKGKLISVIVPIYKVEPYLRQCVDSVLGQTYTNLEIILVDDGSPDNCGVICDEYAARDSRVRVVHKENGGLSDARNAGLDICSGDYITFIDSDDHVAADHVDYLLKLLLDNDADMSAVLPVRFAGETSGERYRAPDWHVRTFVWSGKEFLRHVLYFDNCDICACGKLYQKNLLQRIRYPVGYIFEDIGSTCQVCFLCERVAVSTAAKYFYLQRAQSIEGAPFNPQKMDMLVMVDHLITDTMAQWPELEKALCCRALSSYFHILLQIPDKGCESEKQELWSRIKQVRRTVLFDPDTRPKARAAALLSYTGLRCTHWLGKRLPMRKRKVK